MFLWIGFLTNKTKGMKMNVSAFFQNLVKELKNLVSAVLFLFLE